MRTTRRTQTPKVRQERYQYRDDDGRTYQSKTRRATAVRSEYRANIREGWQ